MSEYQYYEFQALDRPLTQHQISELRAFSSRAQITPYSFVNEYNWGDFKGNPSQWMERYFDAFLYFANWGSRRFMLRLPQKLLDPKTVAAYSQDENFSYRQKDDYIVLSFDAEIEDYEWDEEKSSLASLVTIRSDLTHGDHRALYLGWLLAVQFQEVPDDVLEPTVPPRLGELSDSLDCLAWFLGIDGDLISAAAERSAHQQSSIPCRGEISEWVRTLPSAEKDAIVTRLIDGDAPHLSAEVRQRAIFEISGGVRPDEQPRRTAGEIRTRAATIAAERKRKEAEQRAREKATRERAEADERKKRLESLAGKETDLWSTVDKLISTKQPRRYDQAVSLLQDLHDLAALKGKDSEFKFRVGALQRQNSGKSTLIERFRKAKLLE
ncbi:MAG TPA: hypothetical protein VGW77_03235 [Candidatus Binatia bacterium]|jgi:hypothetical protein|nr:hypothetical protein [Candidatus Binatia bacterium]